MIGVVVQKELREYARDGRVWSLVGLILALIAVGWVTAWSSSVARRRAVEAAHEKDHAAFLAQGEKAPHAAAHFGRMAHKSTPPLATFDPGVSPFLGQVIWLEAHTKNPAMYRAAEDAPELMRLSDLSVAGILAVLVPLLLFVAGHGAFAAEREHGTLRQLISAGAGLGALFVGKLVALAGIGVAICGSAIVSSLELTSEVLERGAGLALGYSCYAVACAAIVLFVSARARTATGALTVLLSFWALSSVVLPRIAASVAERIYPMPDSAKFWADSREALRLRMPARGSEVYRALEKRVLSRAFGRELSDAEVADSKVNREGLSFEISELVGGAIYAERYRELEAISMKQARVRRLIAAFAPVIALQHISSGLAGTDLAAHQHFAREAENHRSSMIRKIHEEMMLRGQDRGFNFLASADFWAEIPDYVDHPPPLSFALETIAWDFALLAAWTIAAVVLALRAALVMRP